MTKDTSIYNQIIADSYDSVYSVLRDPSGDVEFYVAQAKQSGGPILELGCGTGRILLPMAETGVDCVGLDFSPEMLVVLRQKNLPANLELVQGSMEDFDFGERRFKLITIPFRGFQHMLTVEAQLNCLTSIKKHLAPGGKFVFDIFDPDLAQMAISEEPEGEPDEVEHNGETIRRYAATSRDLAQQILKVTFRLEGDHQGDLGTSDIELRWYYRYEIEHLLVRAGFSNLQFFGGFHGTPWQSGEDMVIVASA